MFLVSSAEIQLLSLTTCPFKLLTRKMIKVFIKNAKYASNSSFMCGVRNFSVEGSSKETSATDKVLHYAQEAKKKAGDLAKEQTEMAERAVKEGKEKIHETSCAMQERKGKGQEMMSEGLKNVETKLSAGVNQAAQKAGEVEDKVKEKISDGVDSVKSSSETMMGKAGESVKMGVEQLKKAGSWATTKVKEAVAPSTKDSNDPKE